MKQTISTIIFVHVFVQSFSLVSPFNQTKFTTDSTLNYSFIVSGHFYGNQSNKTGYPCNTLLANLDWINQSKANALFCLGDMFLDVTNDIPYYKESFFNKLQIPLYNAVGNHDLSAEVYQQNFGDTYYYFMVNKDIHLILDTELDNGNIEGKQLELLKEVLNIVNQQTINNVFIYAHRTLWAKHFKELEGLFKDNTQSVLGNNFKADILPLLNQIKLKSKIYWFSGSIGGDAPSSFFYFPKDDITYIATAIRGFKRDAVLLVNVNQKGVTFKTQSLTKQNLQNLATYNVEFWQQNTVKESFNYRLIPLYIKQVVFSRYFWYGFFTLLSIIIVLKFLRVKTFNFRKKI